MKINKKSLKTPIISEFQECEIFFKWAQFNPIARKYLYHIPNEIRCHPVTGSRLKKIGKRKGVSDYHLPYPNKGKHGLWLEVKTKIGKATKEQAEWLADMKELGYEAKLVNGAAEAIKAVEDYLRIG